MKCGYCGSPVNDGLAPCPACGAVYQRRPQIIVRMLQYFGVACLVLGAFEYFGNFDLPIGDMSIPLVIWLGLGIGCFILYRFLVSRTAYRWYRKP